MVICFAVDKFVTFKQGATKLVGKIVRTRVLSYTGLRLLTNKALKIVLKEAIGGIRPYIYKILGGVSISIGMINIGAIALEYSGKKDQWLMDNLLKPACGI